MSIRIRLASNKNAKAYSGIYVTRKCHTLNSISAPESRMTYIPLNGLYILFQSNNTYATTLKWANCAYSSHYTIFTPSWTKGKNNKKIYVNLQFGISCVKKNELGVCDLFGRDDRRSRFSFKSFKLWPYFSRELRKAEFMEVSVGLHTRIQLCARDDFWCSIFISFCIALSQNNICPICRMHIDKKIILEAEQLFCAECTETVLTANENQIVMALECGHAFHYTCLHPRGSVLHGPWIGGYVFIRCPTCLLPSAYEITIFDLSK